ncbi:MAG: hypothetical protein M1358_13940 [Chloroflexi bacterium]|nr:hypothetical protein [Chloroflexota bacterium]
MKNYTPSKECTIFYMKKFSRSMPDWFRLHAKLIALADYETQEIRCSVDTLADFLQHDPPVIHCALEILAAFKFIEYQNPFKNFKEKIMIKVLVRY